MEAYNPGTLVEALEIRKEKQAVPFAGGTDLMVQKKRPAGLVPVFEHPVLFLKGVAELEKIHSGDKELVLGSCVTLSSLLVHAGCPDPLKEALALLASPGIRNLATLGGNICNASPAGDTIPVLYALDSRVEVRSAEGARQMGIEEFILGPGKTALKQDELLTGIIIPLTRFSASMYRKVGTRRANALSKLSFIGLGDVQGGKLLDFRVAFGAVAPRVIRDRTHEHRFAGMDRNTLAEQREETLLHYKSLITPIDDQRSTRTYRKRTALNLLSGFFDHLMQRLEE